MSTATITALPQPRGEPDRIACLEALERRALWLSTWMIHNANHLRPNRDGLKVGGHQASCASAVTLLTALYGHAVRPEDRVAVKPHAGPVFHALMYLMGAQSREALERFRGFGGVQSYPSRTKDTAPVDFSTGSVGLGVGVTLFASLVQDYLQTHGLLGRAPGRMIALLGDAELDEGNIFEALLEGWKHEIRNVWWIIDYNRQSLDGVVADQLFQKIQSFFATVGWNVVTLKYGKLLRAAFAEPGGEALQRWIEDCPNDLYSALTFEGGAGFRRELEASHGRDLGIQRVLAAHDDAALYRLMTDLGGHDMEAVVAAFDEAAKGDRPTCFVAYTVKGWGLPFAGHKDNHAGLMNEAQMEAFRSSQGIASGEEWDRFAGMEAGEAQRLHGFIERAPFRRRLTERRAPAPAFAMPRLSLPAGETMSTQEGFGRLMLDLAKAGGPLAERVVTTSPDVTVSTNLGGWVNQVGLFAHTPHSDVFRDRKLLSAQKWVRGLEGRHIELGIAENNLFLLLAALGLAEPVFGQRLLPVGTVYDPFISRGLDALNYACYQDARFLLVATPSGITLAPEGGAHQSVIAPLIGLGQPGLTMFEPAFVDELAAILRWSFAHMQEEEGGSVYLRLSTRAIEQPKRALDEAGVTAGAYWLREPAPGSEIAVIAAGAVLPEAIEAVARLGEAHAKIGLLVVTSVDRLHAGWLEAPGSSVIDRLLAPLARDAVLATVIDGHPATLSWLGAVRGQRIAPLGVTRFGQSGDISDLYRYYGLDAEAIAAAVERTLVRRVR
ncbi:MAG TPA: transketolase [Dongiaceae bacterium]|nr:transketolase [Dongiaceae bacterium]